MSNRFGHLLLYLIHPILNIFTFRINSFNKLYFLFFSWIHSYYIFSSFWVKLYLLNIFKNFLRCGCTAVGYFVCDTIYNKSELDRKKNLANLYLFFYKKLSNYLWIISNCLLFSINYYKRFSSIQNYLTLGLLLTLFILSFQKALTLWNFLLYVGNYRDISCD